MEVLPWAGGVPPDYLQWDRFQSLFWWKYCPGELACHCAPERLAFVSILVLVEVLPWGPVKAPQIGLIITVSILVLVEVLPWDALDAQLVGHIQVSILVLVEVLPWGVYVSYMGAVLNEFQSLFWWKYCPGYVGFALEHDAAKFQSLFWWKYCPGASRSEDSE